MPALCLCSSFFFFELAHSYCSYCCKALMRKALQCVILVLDRIEFTHRHDVFHIFDEYHVALPPQMLSVFCCACFGMTVWTLRIRGLQLSLEWTRGILLPPQGRHPWCPRVYTHKDEEYLLKKVRNVLVMGKAFSISRN